MTGIPLSQILDIHLHVHTLRQMLPDLDPKREPARGSLHPAYIRASLLKLSDEQLVTAARALSALIACCDVIGLVEVPVRVEDRVGLVPINRVNQTGPPSC